MQGGRVSQTRPPQEHQQAARYSSVPASQKPKKPQNIRTWIRQRTSPFDFGVKTKAGTPAHCNKNDAIKYPFDCPRMGWYGRRLSRLMNSHMFEHFAGKKTFYFTS